MPIEYPKSIQTKWEVIDTSNAFIASALNPKLVIDSLNQRGFPVPDDCKANSVVFGVGETPNKAFLFMKRSDYNKLTETEITVRLSEKRLTQNGDIKTTVIHINGLVKSRSFVLDSIVKYTPFGSRTHDPVILAVFEDKRSVFVKKKVRVAYNVLMRSPEAESPVAKKYYVESLRVPPVSEDPSQVPVLWTYKTMLEDLWEQIVGASPISGMSVPVIPEYESPDNLRIPFDSTPTDLFIDDENALDVYTSILGMLGLELVWQPNETNVSIFDLFSPFPGTYAYSEYSQYITQESTSIHAPKSLYAEKFRYSFQIQDKWRGMERDTSRDENSMFWGDDTGSVLTNEKTTDAGLVLYPGDSFVHESSITIWSDMIALRSRTESSVEIENQSEIDDRTDQTHNLALVVLSAEYGSSYEFYGGIRESPLDRIVRGISYEDYGFGCKTRLSYGYGKSSAFKFYFGRDKNGEPNSRAILSRSRRAREFYPEISQMIKPTTGGTKAHTYYEAEVSVFEYEGGITTEKMIDCWAVSPPSASVGRMSGSLSVGGDLRPRYMVQPRLRLIQAPEGGIPARAGSVAGKALCKWLEINVSTSHIEDTGVTFYVWNYGHEAACDSGARLGVADEILTGVWLLHSEDGCDESSFLTAPSSEITTNGSDPNEGSGVSFFAGSLLLDDPTAENQITHEIPTSVRGTVETIGADYTDATVVSETQPPTTGSLPDDPEL